MRSVSVGRKISSINVGVDDDDDDDNSDEGSIVATGKEILAGGFADEETLTISSVAGFEDSRIVTGVESSGAIEEESTLRTEDDLSSMGVGAGGGVETSMGVVEEELGRLRTGKEFSSNGGGHGGVETLFDGAVDDDLTGSAAGGGQWKSLN